MSQNLHEIDLDTFQCDVFHMFGKATPLLTTGDRASFNTMTIGWGGLGTLWGKPVCTVYVRPERYTYEFMEQYDSFTVSVFGADYKKAMALCGTKSGRDVDKVAECALTPMFAHGDAPYFAEADLVIVCKKLYKQDLTSVCTVAEETVLPYYGEKGNWHRMYVGEVVQVLKK